MPYSVETEPEFVRRLDVDSKGRVVIPAEIRDELGIELGGKARVALPPEQPEQ